MRVRGDTDLPSAFNQWLSSRASEVVSPECYFNDSLAIFRKDLAVGWDLLRLGWTTELQEVVAREGDIGLAWTCLDVK